MRHLAGPTDDLDAAVLRLAHAVGGLDERLARRADRSDRRGRHAVLDQRILDRVGATQRQRHVVVFRARRVGMAGSGDPGAPVDLKAAAACWIVVIAWGDRLERSQSKNTMKDGA